MSSSRPKQPVSICKKRKRVGSKQTSDGGEKKDIGKDFGDNPLSKVLEVSGLDKGSVGANKTLTLNDSIPDSHCTNPNSISTFSKLKKIRKRNWNRAVYLVDKCITLILFLVLIFVPLMFGTIKFDC